MDEQFSRKPVSENPQVSPIWKPQDTFFSLLNYHAVRCCECREPVVVKYVHLVGQCAFCPDHKKDGKCIAGRDQHLNVVAFAEHLGLTPAEDPA